MFYDEDIYRADKKGFVEKVELKTMIRLWKGIKMVKKQLCDLFLLMK